MYSWEKNKNNVLGLLGLIAFGFIFVLYVTSQQYERSIVHTCNITLNSLTDLRNIQSDLHCASTRILSNLYLIDFENSIIRIPKIVSVHSPPAQQIIVQVTARYTGETTHYNPWRAKRPGAQATQSTEAIENAIAEAVRGCQFCQPLIYTAEETWGRISTNWTVSAANQFPLVGPHNGLIIPATHSITKLGIAELEDMFLCAELWYKKVNQNNPELKFPMLIWDTLHHSGASQVHTHAQIWLGRQYTGMFRTYDLASKNYWKDTGRDYWKDLVYLHTELGLGVEYRGVSVITPLNSHKVLSTGGVSVITPLNSHKDYETLVIGPTVDKTFIFILNTIFNTYKKDLKQFCRSMGMSWPELSDTGEKGHIPAVARIGSRGDCSSSISDVSSLELYSFYSVNVNPFTLMRILKRKLLRTAYSSE